MIRCRDVAVHWAGGTDPASVAAALAGEAVPQTSVEPLNGEGALPAMVAPTPRRPDAVAAGSWRRMSALSRSAVCVAQRVLEVRPDVDRAQLAVVWGSCLGEVVPSSRFLDRTLTEGPGRASPLAFQNSVYNAPAGHLSIALGLSGPTDTVCAMGATGLLAVLRAVMLLETGQAPSALVVVGDHLDPVAARGYQLHALTGAPLGESAVALLLERSGSGRPLSLALGTADGQWCRQHRLPGDGPVPPGRGPETHLGLSPTMGALVLAGLLAAGGGSITDHEADVRLTARVT